MAAGKIKRMEIPMFEGVNVLVGSNISKKQELSYALNVRSKKIGLIEKREGTVRLGNEITATNNSGVFYFENSSATNTGFYRISTVGSVTSVYYLNTSGVWTILTGGGTALTLGAFSVVESENSLFFVNGSNTNRYISSDGSTVVTASTVAGNLYNSPVARKINFYKDRLYIADYHVGATKYHTSIMMSSMPVGIVALVDGDHSFDGFGDSTTQFDITTSGDTAIYTWNETGTNPEIATNINVGDILVINGQNFNSANNGTFNVTAVSTNVFEVENATAIGEPNVAIGTGSISSPMIAVTETKYIYASDSLDVYRGNNKIATLTVTAKEEAYIVASASFEAGYSSLDSSDEVWVAGTFSGTRVFRWAGNPATGVNVKEYDTFKLSGGQNDRIKMLTNINDIMMIGNNNNLSIWNGSNLKSLDLGIGCVSDNGFVLALGYLWFIHYTGIYSSEGGRPSMVSAKVEKYIRGATRSGLEHAAAGKKGMSVFFAIGDVTLYNEDGSIREVISDVCLEYNIRQQNWFIHESISATSFATYVETSDADKLEYASKESKYEVMEFLSGNLDNSSDEILFRADTDNLTLATEFEKICYPLEIIVEAERGNGIQVFVSLDNEQFYKIKGDAIKGCTILKINSRKDENMPPRCRRIRVSIRDFSKNLCKISRVAVRYIETLEEEEVKAEINE